MTHWDKEMKLGIYNYILDLFAWAMQQNQENDNLNQQRIKFAIDWYA